VLPQDMHITISSDAKAEPVPFKVILISVHSMGQCSEEFLFSRQRKRNRKTKNNKMKISKDVFIEDLVREFPDAVEYLMKRGIRCLLCGEPAWGTLEAAAKEKGFSPEQIDVFVNELNVLQKE